MRRGVIYHAQYARQSAWGALWQAMRTGDEGVIESHPYANVYIIFSIRLSRLYGFYVHCTKRMG